MKIRKFRSEDAAELARLHRGTIRAVNSRDYDEDQIRAWSGRTSAEKFRDNMHDVDRYVAVIDDKIVGFAEFNPKGEISAVYIHKDHQGMGIAKKLYLHLEVQARKQGIKRFFLTSTITAKPFYEKMGFSTKKKRLHAITDQQLVVYDMEKQLDGL